jgi:hypothetical protein
MLTTGGFAGAISGSLIGIVASNQKTSEPKKTGPFFLSYAVTGALVGMGVGAVVHRLHAEDWVAIRTPYESHLSFEARNEVCAAWN